MKNIPGKFDVSDNNISDKKISGIESIISASVDSNVEFVVGVPGFPITELMNSFLDRTNIDSKWMTNEKSALETALGASVSGRRSIVLIKHVGMNVLCDPLITSVTHTIGSGLVIIAGDDPGVIASQNEQDSRWYGPIAETAVFDPSTPQDAYDATIKGFEISEDTSIPVIIRITHRLEKSQEIVSRSSKIFHDSSMQKKQFDRSIWDLTMRGKHQRLHVKTYPLLVFESENSYLNRCNMRGKDIGIISSGYPSLITENVINSSKFNSSISHLILNMVHPLPFEILSSFSKNHKYTLIIEETEPFIESHLHILDNVLGKMSGHVPYGRIDREHIEFAIDHISETRIDKYNECVETIAKRGPRLLCDECPYLPLYHLLKKLKVKHNVNIAGDLGCSIRSASSPLEAVDTGFSLGSAISVACGFDRKGIAVIGDFGLAHSGITGLINALYSNSDVCVIILKNEVAAMTGGQCAPDLTDLLKSMVSDFSIINMSNYDRTSHQGSLSAIIKNKLRKKGVSVLVLTGKCRKFMQLD